MESKSTRVKGFSLIEMLLVMAILIILMSFGAGAFIGFRETAMIRENVENLTQDVLTAKHLAMNMKRGDEEFWIYGIGIDLTDINTSGNYTFFQWCSEFREFSQTQSSTELIAYDPEANIGEDIGEIGVVQNGYLPLTYGIDCGGPGNTGVEGGVLVSMPGYELDRIFDIAASISLLGGDESPSYVVFETVTGRAFLYDEYGKPINFVDGDPIQYESREPLEILIERRRSRKFDILSIYPISGTVVHHVYSDADLDSTCPLDDPKCIEVGGSSYRRYTLESEIESYRP